MIHPADIDTLDSFKRQTKLHLSRLKKSGSPCVLTVNGKSAIVVQDAKAYARQMAAVERAETMNAIRESIAQFDRGEYMEASAAFKRLRQQVSKRKKAS